jgi:teichoic acid transport system ATP-binding protein
MKLRLGFAVAVHANPDILILDEGLSVGDRDFQKKSQVKIQEFFRKGKTILVVTHWLDFVRRNCNRIVILRKGSVAADGPISLMNQYERG